MNVLCKEMSDATDTQVPVSIRSLAQQVTIPSVTVDPAVPIIHLNSDYDEFQQNSNNNWNARKENQLREWQQKCKIRSYSHSLTHEYFALRFKQCIIFSIISSALSTVFNGASLLNPTNQIPFTLIALFSSAMVAGVGTWLQSSNPASTASSHAQIASGYQRIILEIDSELINDPPERTNGAKFIHRVSDQISELATSAVIVPLDIWMRVTRRIATGKLDVRQLQGDIDMNTLDISRNDTIIDVSGSPVTEPPPVSILAQTPAASTDAVVDMSAAPVDVSLSYVPRSELRIPGGSVNNKFMVEYQMNRFGIS